MSSLRAACVAVSAGVVLAAAGSASADVEYINFSFSNLSASFINGASVQDRVFSAGAVANSIQTGGQVVRADVTPSLTAEYSVGFAGLSIANFAVQMNVDTVLVGNQLAATGTFTITDDDGDTISGNITGNWTDLGFGFNAFQGVISDAVVTPSGGGDNLNFNGPSGGAFPYAGLPMSDLSGAFVQLQLTSGTFFNADFANIPSHASGVLVPAPAGLALLGLGGLAAARRRR